MKILEGLTLESLFLIVFGVFVFVLGTTTLRAQRNWKKKGMVLEGTVLKSNLVLKRDSQDSLIQYYYELRVQYFDNGHKIQNTVSSPREFLEGDTVGIVKSGDSKAGISIYENNKLPVLIPWTIIFGGILIAMLPIAQRRYGEQSVSILLIAILILAGISLITSYLRDRKRKVMEIEATVIDLLKWSSGKKDSKLTKPSTTYYPILQYRMEDKVRTIRSKYSSSLQTAYKIGDKKTLYYGLEDQCILERNAKMGMLVGGIIFLTIALIGIISTLQSLF